MNQDNQTNRKYRNAGEDIDLLEVAAMLWSKVYLIILAGVLCALLVFIGTKMFITPMYTSETKMYVLSKQDKNDSVTYSDLQTGSQLTKDYTELIKSRPVLEQVISILNLDMEVDTLKDRISVETPTDTRIISISVEDEDPEMAKQIADTVREAASIQITEIMDLDAVNQIEEGSLPTEPSSPNLKRNTIVGGVAGIVLVVAILVLIYMLDDTIKTAEDVENYLDLNVLASLPLEEGTKNKKRTKKLELRKLMKKMKKA